MRWTCVTPGCEVCGHYDTEPGHCSICLADLVGVYDTTGECVADAIDAFIRTAIGPDIDVPAIDVSDDA